MSNSSPTVSVLMPAYNHELYVREAVTSVLGQTYGDLELIAIDDASTDGTWSVLASINDERLRCIQHKTNQGAHKTLNEALALARGDFIAIINSDDVFHPLRIERMLSHMESNPGVSACFSLYDYIDHAGNLLRDAVSLRKDFPDAQLALGQVSGSVVDSEIQVLSLLARNYLHTTSNLFCRRKILLQVGAFRDFRYAHDHDIFLRLAYQYSIYVIPESLLGYRHHASNTLSENAEASVSETAAMLAEFLLTHSLTSLEPKHPAFVTVLSFLVSHFSSYGGEKLILFLIFVGFHSKVDTTTLEPIFTDFVSSPEIRHSISASLHASREVNNLRWQEAQTTKWWEKANQYLAQLDSMREENGKLLEQFNLVYAEKAKLGDELLSIQKSLSESNQQMIWWRNKYLNTPQARLRGLIKELLNASFRLIQGKSDD